MLLCYDSLRMSEADQPLRGSQAMLLSDNSIDDMHSMLLVYLYIPMHGIVHILQLHVYLSVQILSYYGQMLRRSSLLLNGIAYNHAEILVLRAADQLYYYNHLHDKNNNL